MPTSFDTARATLSGDSAVSVVRSFRASRAVVYRAFTDPDLVRRWMLGPPGWTMPVCDMDVRVGGSFRWVWQSTEDGSRFGFHGVFRVVDPPERISHTEIFDPGEVGNEMGEALITVTFDEHEGVTTATTVMDFGSSAAREAAMATGMTDGMEMSYQQLDRVLTDESAHGSGS